MMRGVRAVIFDLDETLADVSDSIKATHSAVAKRISGYLKEQGIIVDEEEILPKLRAIDDRMNFSREYDRNKWWPILLSELGVKLELPFRMLNELTSLFWRTYAENTKLYPDAEPTLEYLRQRGYKIGLVTDTDGKKGMKRARLEQLGLNDLFGAVVVGGDDTPRTKPDPGPFLIVAERLEVDPSSCVVVGDKPFTDIDGGNAAGMRTILLKRRDWGVKESSNLTIKSLSELRGIL